MAHVTGQLVAVFLAVQWGPLIYVHLNRLKSAALRQNKSVFEEQTGLTREAEKELEW